MRICFASHNQNKVKEIAELAPEGIKIVGLDDLNIFEHIPETGVSIEKNSRIKANYVHSRLNISVFSDDSGLEVNALHGTPGVYSARYAGEEKNGQNNNALLLKNLLDKKDRSAQFKTVITFISEDAVEIQFTGTVRGKIEKTPRGTKGFAYDSLFVPDGSSKTFAEMDLKEKNMLSHRAKAFQQLLSYLQGLK